MGVQAGSRTTATNGVVTATITIGSHSLVVGSPVTVSGVTPTGYNGNWTLSAVAATTISYVIGMTDPGAYSANGNAYLTDITTGRVSIPISLVAGTKKFRQMSRKLSSTGGPEVYSEVYWAEVLDDIEYFEFVVDVHDEDTGMRGTSAKQRSAQTILDLFTNRTTGLKFTKNIVTLAFAETPVPGFTTNVDVRIVDAEWKLLAMPAAPDYRGMRGTLSILCRTAQV